MSFPASSCLRTILEQVVGQLEDEDEDEHDSEKMREPRLNAVTQAELLEIIRKSCHDRDVHG